MRHAIRPCGGTVGLASPAVPGWTGAEGKPSTQQWWESWEIATTLCHRTAAPDSELTWAELPGEYLEASPISDALRPTPVSRAAPDDAIGSTAGEHGVWTQK
ncbi:hypothetical protein NDU88_000214 [Pleurodeles waltl]|uniref:Uncharacterized protein n=1 Tax=Pleurodeles waltl TaxID=8319 RepID=A0AAV7UPD0_PLEWA|nr:hypothetical protein NDU88_000214 [Pleurodeles waltl]